jgi:FKBP-type peptidyl-prolyl cis-trans isomerase FkpA
LKLKTWFAAAAVSVLAACSLDTTGSTTIDIGPPPALPAGADTVTTASGLKYVDVALGSGTVAQAGDQVSVHYTGWLSDGTPFDTSRGGAPLLFTLGAGNVIAGFDEGVQGMEPGGKRRLIVPPALGYGSTGAGPIPPNATLIFDVELVAVRR